MIPAASTLHREHTALLVIDIQEGLAAVMQRREAVTTATTLLLRVAGLVGLPIVVTRQYPRGLGELEAGLVEVLSEVEGAGAQVSRIDKLSFDCFAEEEFRSAVAAVGASQLLVAGMETHICVTQTALAGLREGFDVHVAADACCSRSSEHHALTLQRLATAGAVVTNVESAAYELVGRAGTTEFKELLAAVKRAPAL